MYSLKWLAAEPVADCDLKHQLWWTLMESALAAVTGQLKLRDCSLEARQAPQADTGKHSLNVHRLESMRAANEAASLGL